MIRETEKNSALSRKLLQHVFVRPVKALTIEVKLFTREQDR